MKVRLKYNKFEIYELVYKLSAYTIQNITANLQQVVGIFKLVQRNAVI